MFNLFSERPDHPMFDLEEAQRLLSELPEEDIPKSLEEITFWLDSIKNAAGFTPELRIAIVMLLDEAGQVRLTEILGRYLDAPHLHDFQGLRQWQSIHAFAQTLSVAYAACIAEYQQAGKNSFELKEKLPLICVRQLRAASEQMNLELLRYLEVDPVVWQQLCACYRFAESVQCTETNVFAYHGHVVHTNPQREMLRALVLYISSTDTLAADQVEVSYRIAGRLASFFDLRTTADTSCPYVFDLAADAPPHRTVSGQSATPTVRYFGTARALPALQRIIEQYENDPAWQERRFGSEFTPAGKLTVLKHLTTYWAAEPPHQHMQARSIDASIDVAHGFRVISQIVTHIDAGNDAEKDVDTARTKIGLTAIAAAEYTTEVWHITEMSPTSVGAMLTGTQGEWIKIGDLCAAKPQNGPTWWVGMVGRLHTDSAGKIHVGIELLTKRPASVWLRVLGKGIERTSNWESSSGSFSYDYLPVILLPDEHNAYLHATLLIESGCFVKDAIYQMMMGEKSRDIKLTKLLAEGEDFEQVEFEWLG